jgi:hypothetical protein
MSQDFVDPGQDTVAEGVLQYFRFIMDVNPVEVQNFHKKQFDQPVSAQTPQPPDSVHFR